MADEVVTTEQPVVEEATPAAEEPALTVEVERERGRTPVTDEDLAKLTSVNDDDIERANRQAKDAVKSLRLAYQEQRRRAEQWARDAGTAGSLAEQLYRENQELKQNVTRSESALIAQALGRAEAQLEGAKNKSKQALASGDPDLIVAANEDVARSVAEVDRLKMLKPAAEEAPPREGTSAPQPQAPPTSQRTREWVAQNSWFGKDQEMTNFAMRQHQHLALDGITEESNPDLYWRSIEDKLKQQYPEKYGSARPTEGRAKPPVAVTGGTRSNGAPAAGANGKRTVHLTESQVRLASRLGLTPLQYAESLIKEQEDEQQGSRRRTIQ